MPAESHAGHRTAPSRLGLPTRLLGFALAVLLLWAGVIQIRAALAIRYSDRADAAMIYWSSPAMKRNPHPGEILHVWNLLARARALAPDDPTHHERLAQLYLWELATQSPTTKRRRTLHPLGLAEVRRVVAARPGWALAWAALLVWKAEFEELDEEFRIALERATTLGQWHFAVHGSVLQAAFPLWDQLSPADRDRVLDTGVRGLRQYPKLALPILKSFDRLADVCRRVDPSDPLFETSCKPVAPR